MKECPHCGEKIPLRKYFFLTNKGTIKCDKCNAELLPDKKSLSLIGGISGFSSALTVGLGAVIYYLLERKYLSEIIIIVSLSVLSIFIASSLLTRNIVKLKKSNYEETKKRG